MNTGNTSEVRYNDCARDEKIRWEMSSGNMNRDGQRYREGFGNCMTQRDMLIVIAVRSYYGGIMLECKSLRVESNEMNTVLN